MTIRSLRVGKFAWPLLAAAALFAGCHHVDNATPGGPTPTPTTSGSGSPTNTPTATGSPSTAPTLPATTASTVFNLNPTGGSVTLSSSGLAGTLVYPSGTFSGTASAQYTLTTVPPSVVPSPAPTGTGIAYFLLQVGTPVAFSAGIYVSPVILPSGYAPGSNFVQTLYDQTTGTAIGTPTTGTLSGSSISFPAVPTAFTANAFDVYLIVVSTY